MIITKGFGNYQMITTKGYGTHFVPRYRLSPSSEPQHSIVVMVGS